MASTTFVNASNGGAGTPIVASWLNDVNNFVYNGTLPSGGSAITVGAGGTGETSFTAYAPIAGGSTSTSALVSLTTGISNSGYVLTSNGSSAAPTWQASGSSITPGGSSGQIQYNNSGTALGGISGVTTNGTSLTIANGDLHLTGTSTGYTILNSGLSSTSNNTLTLPTTSSDTLAALGTTQTWTAVQTFSNPIAVGSGGTGDSSFTAYAPIAAGSTSTSALVSLTSGISNSGYVLTSNGSSAAPTWQASSGGSGTPGGSSGQVQYNNSSSFGGISGVTTNGTSLTIANSDLHLTGSSTGYTILNSGLSSTSNNTLTLPTTSSDTLAALGTAQTFTALQKFNASEFALVGTSTGYTTLNSGLTGSSNNTLTLPTTSSDTLAALGTAQTWTGTQTFATISATTATFTNPITVANGGTGSTSYTAYAPILGGTTSTGSLQSASAGISNVGYVLTSNGSSAAPTWQSAGTSASTTLGKAWAIANNFIF